MKVTVATAPLKIEWPGIYRARVKIRRGERWPVKPECDQLDGQVLDFSVGWRIDASESDLYAGEHAMIPPTYANWPIGWVASGDLEFMERVTEKTIDFGVLDETTGKFLRRVAADRRPSSGEYTVDEAGTYTFSAADEGHSMLIDWDMREAVPDKRRRQRA